MNKDVTNLILAWVECSNAVWGEWFKGRYDAIDRFSEVEDALFRALVADQIAAASVKAANLEVMYQGQVEGLRQVCRRQKAGNIFCEPQNVSLDSTVFHRLRDIDPMGTMMDGEPYAEVFYQGESYILEPITALRFFVRTPDSPPSTQRDSAGSKLRTSSAQIGAISPFQRAVARWVGYPLPDRPP